MDSTTDKLLGRHPLQRLSSPSREFSSFVHTVGIISFSLSFKYLIDFPSVINSSYGWHWSYLTILGLGLAQATFVIGLLADLTLSPTLFSIKNTMSLCSAPLEVLISILYWSINAIDPSLLVLPGIAIAPWADIGFHLLPSTLLVFDLLLLSPPWTIRALPAMALSSTLAISYWAWIERCYSFNGYYPYPLMEHLNTNQRVVLFTVAALLMTGSTIVLKWLYGMINGLQENEITSTPGSLKAKKTS